MESREEGLFSGKGLEFLGRLVLPELDQMILDDLLGSYGEVQAHLRKTDGIVEKLYEELEAARRIDTVPGFATTLSVLVAVEIGDIDRFESAAHLQAYAGVIPTTHSSGGRTYHGRITKAGNPWLRWAVLEAVFPSTQASLEIRGLYSRLARRKNPNVAKVAVARRLLAIIYRLLKEKRDYIRDMNHPSVA